MIGYEEKTEWQIHQSGELISEGEFETEAEAVATVDDLRRNLGWTRLEVVERTVLVPVSN